MACGMADQRVRGVPARRRVTMALGLGLVTWSALIAGVGFVSVDLERLRSPAVLRRAGPTGPKKATPQEPWKPLVFKMPQKKQPRTLEPGDDDFTMKMRDRLKALKLKEEDQPDDLVTVSTENAKNLALSAMWYIDQEADRVKEEKKNPDIHVLRRRYEGAMEKLIIPEEKDRRDRPGGVSAPKSGTLEVPGALDVDALFERAQQTSGSKTSKKQALQAEVEDETEDEGIAEYLISMQKVGRRKAKEGRPRRERRSPEERRQDYEDTKIRMFAFTAAFGGLGTGFSMVMYGVNVAFSFGLGAIGGLSYLSGLASYTDNAENAMGALGARRLLTPVVVLLIVQAWPRIEAQVPEIADLHLEPSLFPAILGFFTYTVGKVLAGLLK